MVSVRNELIDVYRKIRSGEIASHDGRVMVYALQQLSEFVKGADLETMLQRLERREEGTGDFGGGLRAD